MPDDVVVIGAGGHAKVCIEILRDAGYSVPYCIGAEGSTASCLDVPVLAGDDFLGKLRADGFEWVFVALGSNALRVKLAGVATQLGFELVQAISPAAKVSRSARIDPGVAVMGGAVINAEAHIGRLAIINTGATVDHDCRIDEGVHIAPQSGLAGNVVVGARSFLGVGCSVIPERTIGADVTVGAGSVVIADLPDRVTAVGVPARIVRNGATS